MTFNWEKNGLVESDLDKWSKLLAAYLVSRGGGMGHQCRRPCGGQVPRHDPGEAGAHAPRDGADRQPRDPGLTEPVPTP